MTGYLYRTAVSVLQPDAPIHPIVRPVFSSLESRESSDLPTLVEEGTVTALVRPARASEAEAPPRSTPGLLPEAAPAARSAEPRPERQEQRAGPAPARTGAPRRYSAPGWPATHVQMPAERARTTPVLAAPREEAAGSFDVPETESVAASQRRAASSAVIPSPAAPGAIDRWPVPLAAEPRPASAPRRGLTTARDSEDVQIQIGRIEVMAVNAEPARPAAVRPPRKAVSLGDYLRRRDGGRS
jgi:hypothetical protein